MYSIFHSITLHPSTKMERGLCRFTAIPRAKCWGKGIEEEKNKMILLSFLEMYIEKKSKTNSNTQ